MSLLPPKVSAAEAAMGDEVWGSRAAAQEALSKCLPQTRGRADCPEENHWWQMCSYSYLKTNCWEWDGYQAAWVTHFLFKKEVLFTLKIIALYFGTCNKHRITVYLHRGDSLKDGHSLIVKAILLLNVFCILCKGKYIFAGKFKNGFNPIFV